MKNKYPRGKLNESDEGAMEVIIRVEDKTVIIEFAREIKWIGMDKFAAIALGNAILEHANSIEVKK